ncbi:MULTISPECIES: hypothetical protein [unclassified Imperialibacter]|uniref:hypothetical protein n=1 Tax=unclassified Imperialibacter TaxID=2629706 RepID=UPI00125BD018|nr:MULTISPECIES: hypothetical protein [unclassified Imperialibacter]CAD5273824.1 conserved hypothetical protein [Imperialibacter sp. 75]CAD5274194.1 conserved hypothetical protein [Imperialibacter sp. 89]VVT22604.1 conserved hypothetical protein [Imperialibacter sp. EC-SDR9]
MTRTEELFHQIAESLPDGKKSKMFGAICVKAPNGKAAFMAWKDNMVFKLEGDAQKEALSLDGCEVFRPMPERPPMGGWIRVPVDYETKWPAFAKQALGYVKTL